MSYLQVHRSLAILETAILSGQSSSCKEFRSIPRVFLTVDMVDNQQNKQHTDFSRSKFMNFLGNPCRSERSNTCKWILKNGGRCDSMWRFLNGKSWNPTEKWLPFGKRLKWMESLACPERLPGGFTIKTEHHTNLYSAGCSNPVAIGQLWMITDTQ